MFDYGTGTEMPLPLPRFDRLILDRHDMIIAGLVLMAVLLIPKTMFRLTTAALGAVALLITRVVSPLQLSTVPVHREVYPLTVGIALVVGFVLVILGVFIQTHFEEDEEND